MTKIRFSASNKMTKRIEMLILTFEVVIYG